MGSQNFLVYCHLLCIWFDLKVCKQLFADTTAGYTRKACFTEFAPRNLYSLCSNLERICQIYMILNLVAVG